jgi:hypothetical protein
VEAAVQPLATYPELRARLLEIRRAHDIIYDEVNPDDSPRSTLPTGTATAAVPPTSSSRNSLPESPAHRTSGPPTCYGTQSRIAW